MQANLLEVRGATRRFGGLVAVDGVGFQVQKNEIFGLIGPNGAGKTTLFNLITGLIPLSSGDLIYQGDSLANYRPHQIAKAGIARTFQNLRLFGELSALENVAIAGHIHNSSNLWTGILGLPASRREEEKTYKRAGELLDLVGLTDQSNRKARNLAYGDQRRLEIARALALQPQLLLLDEPAAGMNPTTPLHEDTLIDLPPETPHQEAQRCTRNNPCRMQGCMICPTPTNHVRNLDEELKALIPADTHLNEKYKRYNSHHDSWTVSGEKRLVWDKNVVFFPRRINGKLWFLHRIKPDIQIASVHEVDELNPGFWKTYLGNLEQHIALSPRYEHEISYLGAGCPPIETPQGWILIYHSVHDTMEGYVYSACAALMSLSNPQHELARLPYPLFVPEESWEHTGEVNNVVFPTGAAVFDDTLYIYYGAADEQIGCFSLSLSGLLGELSVHLNPAA